MNANAQAEGGRATRPETPADRAAVRAVNMAAFPPPHEANLVGALREDPDAWLPGLSWVATGPDGAVAAHALLTRCRVDGADALALAPVAAAPGHQRRGRARPPSVRHRRQRRAGARAWCWSSATPSTTPDSVSGPLPATASCPVSTYPTRR